MPVDIEKERKERTKLWGGRFAEPAEVMPIQIRFAEPGSVCRLWFMPNDSQFVVIGNQPGRTAIVTEDGQATGFTHDALVVVISGPPVEFADLLPVIEGHRSTLRSLAWCGRSAE